MPEVLRLFLASLEPKEAAEVWNYLDGTPDAISEMLETLPEIPAA